MISITFDLKTNKMIEAKNIDDDQSSAVLWKKLWYSKQSSYDMLKWANDSKKLDSSAKSIVGSK